MQRIVVGYDGSPASRRALEEVAVLARAFDSDVIVATVEENAPTYVAAGSVTDLAGMSSGASPEVDRISREKVDRLAHEAQALLAAENVPSHPVSMFGSADHELAALAEEHHADLVVVGASEPGFISRLIFGNTGAYLAKRAPCDVLIVHP
jgi:nucleotide-binding universal stress UspA family protein